MPIMTLNEGDEDLHFDSSEDEQQDDPDQNQEPIDDNFSDSELKLTQFVK